jgi:molecular chaperone Hsp33
LLFMHLENTFYGGKGMKNYIVNALAFGGTVRALAANTTEMVGVAAKCHTLSYLATAALGRTMTGAAMMARLLKGEKDVLTLQIKGDGPLGGIVVVADSSGNLRGYVNEPHVELPLTEEGKLDVAWGVGLNGYLNVIKDMGMKEPYVGYVRLVSGEIAEDITYYLAFSEQVPSAVALGVLIDASGKLISSGGFMIQLMPDAQEEAIIFLEQRIKKLSPISSLLAEGKSPEQVLEIIFEGKDLKFIDKAECRYSCNCSRERMERNLISLGAKELQDLIDEQHEAELHCHFCNSKYNFTENELKELLMFALK